MIRFVPFNVGRNLGCGNRTRLQDSFLLPQFVLTKSVISASNSFHLPTRRWEKF